MVSMEILLVEIIIKEIIKTNIVAIQIHNVFLIFIIIKISK
jgi:hypothetical protein